MKICSLRTLRCLGAGLIVAALLPLGCKSTRDAFQQAMDQPDFRNNRKKMVESGQRSCETAWQKTKPNDSPAMVQTMHTFCNCIAIRTSESYTDAELVELGLRGPESKTPEQKARTADNIKVCEAQAGIP